MVRQAKSKEKSSQERRVRFTFEPRCNTGNGFVFEWLIHKAFDGKEKVGLATRSFWLPYACRDKGNYSEAELRELAQQSIWRLEEQIQSLRESFGVKDVSQRIAAPPVTQPTAISETKPTEEPQTPMFAGIDTKVDEGMLGDFGDVIG